MHPIVKLLPGRHKRVKSGHPWVFSNEIADSAAAAEIEAGSAVTIVGDNGETYGTAIFNPHSLVAGRIVDRKGDVALDADFFAGRLRGALALRERLYDEPYYRLVHAEADGLPGLVIDRYGDAAVLQLNTAGMARNSDAVIEALDRVLPLQTIILRNDSPSRLREGLSLEVATLRGKAPTELRENGATFVADLTQGQKTGWFYDQRENRRFLAALAKDARFIDFYGYGGGFAIQALIAGAKEAAVVDRSRAALENAAESAARNDVAARCGFVKADAFAEMERQFSAGERYDIVVADPPSFVKSRKDLNAGSRAYRKMTRLAARLVAPGGLLFVASCSHNVTPVLFGDIVRKGLADAGRGGRILRAAGAAPDHPVHPNLSETAYLKSLTLQLD